MSPAAVHTERLTKRFGRATAVDAVDLTVPAGAVTALLGPNGAGKTTTVRLLATLTRPTSGVARVFGHDVTTQADAVRSAISLTGQFAALEDNLTARENLLLMARLRGGATRPARTTVEELVDRFDLTAFAGRTVKTLSGGQRRRVDLAAALVVRPRLLVLDEPTTGLDPGSRQAVWSTVRDLVDQGVTVLLTTQYLEEADALAHHVVLVDRGRITARGTPAEIKGRIGAQRVDVTATDAEGYRVLHQALAAAFDVTTAQERRTLSVPAPRATADLAAVTAVVTAVVQATGADVEEIALRRPTLDEAFLALTGEPTKEQA